MSATLAERQTCPECGGPKWNRSAKCHRCAGRAAPGQPFARPFPLAPLDALMPDLTHAQRATRLGIQSRQYERHRHHGALTVDEADRYATRLNRHPSEVWGDLWWQQADQEAAAS